MTGRCFTVGARTAGFIGVLGAYAHAQPSASLDPASVGSSRAIDAPSSSGTPTKVERLATRRGFTFYPSTPELNAFRLAIGAFYDAIDPQVMYGFNVRLPQLTLDARYGLGRGWSLKGHFNSMFVTTELLLGASYAGRVGKFSLEGSASAGIYIGQLAELGFDAQLLSPEYRPELTLGYDLENIALSLRATLLLMGPESVRVGDVWGGLDNSNAFVGHSEMLYVENTTSSSSVWYFGGGVMTTRSYYALWLLFPDSPGLFTYPRLVAGYEF